MGRALKFAQGLSGLAMRPRLAGWNNRAVALIDAATLARTPLECFLLRDDDAGGFIRPHADERRLVSKSVRR